MGNKQDKLKNTEETIIIRTRTPAPLKPPPVSGTSFELFLTTLSRLPFTLTEEQFETIVYDVIEKTFVPGDVIIKEGQPPEGLFVIVNGTCNVLSSNSATVLRCLKKEDFFGEISCFYNHSCSCSVVCSSEGECGVIFLPYPRFEALVQTSELISMKQWFIIQKYIDMSCIFLPTVDISEIIIKRSMLQSPLFNNWCEEAIDLVYKNILPYPVEVYASSQIIFFPADEDACGYLLVTGEVEVFSENNSIIIDAKENSVWFGDEQLFSTNPRLLTARARSPCQVVTFTPESIQSVTSEFASETSKLIHASNYWKKHLQARNHDLYEKHYEVMNTTFLCHNLKKSSIFNFTNLGFMYYIALGTIIRLLKEDDVIMVHDVSSESEQLIIIILSGGGVVMKPNAADNDINLYPGDMFYFVESFEEKSHVKAIEETLVGLISKSLIEDVKNTYPEALVNVDW